MVLQIYQLKKTSIYILIMLTDIAMRPKPPKLYIASQKQQSH